MNLKEQALSYAALGFAVFPLKARDKKPAISGWNTLATTDYDVIAKWWTENPQYNIGIATGRASGGLVVIDLDIDEGKNGVERLKLWEKSSGMVIPKQTAVAITGRGGRHLYYKSEVSFHNAADLFGDNSGVDVRGEGGFVVAPGSVHPNGTTYSWELHPLLYGISKTTKEVEALLSVQKGNTVPGSGSVAEGERNSTLFNCAVALIKKGLSTPAVLAAVEAENASKCSPPLPKKEVESIVASAARYREEAQNLSVDLVTLEDIEEKSPKWLVEGFIPRGEICILAGDGGTGKTFVWCSIAAAVSSGKRCFLQNNLWTEAVEREPEDVLFFSSEDSYEYVLRRRLRKNGASLKRIRTLDCADERFSAVTLNGKYLDELLKVYKPALCIFDPLQAFVGGANMISRSEMRECLKLLHVYGKKYGTSFLIVMHTNKMQSVWGRSRLSDSSDIWDIARSVFIVGKADENGTRYISHEKSNYAQQKDTVLFKLIDEVVTFQQYTDKRDRDFVLSAGKAKREKPATEEAENFIVSYLDEQGGSCDLKDMNSIATVCGIKGYAMKEAKQKLKEEGKIKIESISKGQGKGFEWKVFRMS